MDLTSCLDVIYQYITECKQIFCRAIQNKQHSFCGHSRGLTFTPELTADNEYKILKIANMGQRRKIKKSKMMKGL